MTPRQPSTPPPGHITHIDTESNDAYEPAEWMSFKRDVRQWREFMTDQGVDMDSQMELFMLAQHSKEGYELAMGVLHKVMKKKIDGTSFKNVSAFVHVCCKRSFEWFSKYSGDDDGR
jgi:hypothetical protein